MLCLLVLVVDVASTGFLMPVILEVGIVGIFGVLGGFSYSAIGSRRSLKFMLVDQVRKASNVNVSSASVTYVLVVDAL